MSELRIALFLHDRQNDYQLLIRADCEQAARRLDSSLSVTSADKSVETQIRQIRAALAEPASTRPRAIMVCPVSEVALMPLIHEAAKLGVAWVVLSRWNDAIHEFRRQYQKVPIFAVLPDHFEVGRIQGQQLRTLLGNGGEVVFIQGPIATYSTRRRREGLEEEVAARRDIRWSYLNGDWSVEGGQTVMASWLSAFIGAKLPEFIILAQNDSMAMGARQAVTRWGATGKGRTLPADVIVMGCDGSPDFGARLVSTGELTATVVIPAVSGRALEEVVAALRFGKTPAAEITVAVRSLPDLATLAKAIEGRSQKALRP